MSDKAPDWAKAEANRLVPGTVSPYTADQRSAYVSMVAAALLSAYRRGREEQWQPIETAPKDRKIIVWLADEGFPVMATWRELDKGTDDEWSGFWIWEMDYGQDFHDITHWQPLPAPPAIRRLGEAE